MISENPVDESEPGSDANRESAQQSGHSKPAVPPAPPTPKLPPTPTQHYQPDRRKDNTPPWKKRGEIAAIIIAFGLLVVNTFALPTVKKAADAAKSAADTARLTLQQSVETFRIDERAWVEIEPIKPNLFTARTPQFGASFNYDIYPKNVGKTAAHNITVKAETTSSSVEFGTHAD